MKLISIPISILSFLYGDLKTFIKFSFFLQFPYEYLLIHFIMILICYLTNCKSYREKSLSEISDYKPRSEMHKSMSHKTIKSTRKMLI